MATAKESMNKVLKLTKREAKSQEKTIRAVDKAAGSAKTGAPKRAMALAGRLPGPLGNLWVLGVGAILSIIALVALLAYNSQTSAAQARYVEVASYMLMGSQRLAKDAREAVLGNDEAFKTLTETRDSFSQVLTGLADGSNELNVKKTPATLGPQLSDLQGRWAKVQENVDQILKQRATLLTMRNDVRAVNQRSPLLLAQSDEVVELLSKTSASTALLNLAGLQRTLSQRITKDVNVFALGGTSAAVAATQFGKDIKRFEATSRQVRSATGPVVHAKLDQVDKTFREVNTSVANILDKIAEFFGSQRAAAYVIGESDGLLKSAQNLVAGYAGLTPQAGILKLLPFLLGLLAAGFLALFVYALVGEARERAQASAEANRSTQDAILKLLDEMGSLADGDLTIEPEVTDQVTGAIADSVKYAVREMRGIVKRINDTSQAAARESDETRGNVSQLAAASERQAQQISGTSEEVQEMARSMDTMSSNAKKSEEAAKTSLQVARKGASAVKNTIAGLDEMREQIQDTAKRIKRLGESSQQIGEIVSLIDDIAEQTNILSLNASIQAAMAGEAGRGFAVVADEVQRLAERSAEATKQIGELVKNIQADTNEAVTSMENATRGMVVGTQVADTAGQALSEIESTSEHLADLIGTMAAAANDQSERATNVSESMNEIRSVTTQTSSGTRATAESIGKLTELVRDLQASVAGFKLPA